MTRQEDIRILREQLQAVDEKMKEQDKVRGDARKSRIKKYKEEQERLRNQEIKRRRDKEKEDADRLEREKNDPDRPQKIEPDFNLWIQSHH